MDREPILTALDSAAQKVRSAVADVDDISAVGLALGVKPELRAATDDLAVQLAQEPELELYSGTTMQLFCGTWARLSCDQLAQWLMIAAAQRSSSEALDHLERYLSEDQFAFRVGMGLAGIRVQGETTVAEGIELTDSSILPPVSFSTGQQFDPRIPEPTCALVQTRQQRRVYSPPEDMDDLGLMAESQRVARSDLEDAVLCMTLVGPCAPVATEVWYLLDQSAPGLLGSHAEIARGVEVGPTTQLSPEQGIEIGKLLELFRALSQAHRDRLKVPLGRLNSAMRRRDPVDAAIDLGIALEAVFIPKEDERGEYTYKIRVRAAHFMGEDKATRNNIYGLAGKLYQLRSTAVHNGRLAEGSREVLQEGYGLVGSALQKLLSNPSVDWKSVVVE